MQRYDMSDIQSDLVTLGVYLVRRVVGCYLRCSRSRHVPVVKRSCHLSNRVLEEGEVVPRPILLETWTQGSKTKSWIQYAGETIVEHPSPFSLHYRAPWLWVGYKTVSGDMIDLTNEMAQFVVAGNLIKPELIHTLFPRSETGLLIYIDPKTFEIKDLSSDGLVIEDAIPPPPSSPVPELVPDSGRVCESSAYSGALGVDGHTSVVE